MSPTWIRKRDLPASTRAPKGRRSYQVLYRRGGRLFPVESAGSFKTEKEAKLRRDLVGGWLAAGLNPKTELAKIAVAPPVVRTLTEQAAAFMRSRIDIAASTTRHTEHALKVLTDTLGDRDPSSVRTSDLQEIIGSLSDRMPSTVKSYVDRWRMLFDFAGVEPNPARSKQLRLPRIVREEVNPPTWEHLVTAIAAMPHHYHLPLIVAEQTAMRVGEIESLAWGDVDEVGDRFRLRAASTKTGRARWVQVPDWLMAHISETCAPEDRVPDRRVFPRFNQGAARQTLARACTRKGVPAFTPHDLRHRRATIWHHSGLPLRVLMERGGWTTTDVPVEVYSHLMPLDEAPIESLTDLLVRTR